MGYAMSQVPRSRIKSEGAVYMRDAIVAKLAKWDVVNTRDNPLVKPDAPRVVYVKSKLKAPKRLRKGRKSRKS
jgi:hypothetical protein